MPDYNHSSLKENFYVNNRTPRRPFSSAVFALPHFFESVNEILLGCTVSCFCFSVFHKIKFGIFLEFSFWERNF